MFSVGRYSTPVLRQLIVTYEIRPYQHPKDIQDASLFGSLDPMGDELPWPLNVPHI